MPKDSKKKKLPGWGYAAAGAIPAGLVYALSRRARPGLLGDKITQAIRSKGLYRGGLDTADIKKVESAPFSNLLKYLTYGTTHIGEQAATPKSLKGAVNMQFDQKARGPLSIGPSAKDKRFFGNDDKLQESKALHRLLPEYAPDVTPLSKIFGGKQPRVTSAKFRPWLEARLKRLGNRYILKGRDDFQSAGTLIDDTSDLDEILPYLAQKANKRIPGLSITPRQLEQLRKTDPAQFIAYLKSADPGYAEAWRLKNYLKNPASGFAQRRVELGDEGVLGRPEFRVHVVNGKVVPGSQARLSYVRALLGQLRLDPQAKQIEAQLAKKLERALAQRGLTSTMALDVGVTREGKPVIFEGNANSMSGFLHPSPGWRYDESLTDMLTNHHLVSALQGRDTHLLAGMKGLGAGGVGVGGYGVARGIAGSRNDNRPQGWPFR